MCQNLIEHLAKAYSRIFAYDELLISYMYNCTFPIISLTYFVQYIISFHFDSSCIFYQSLTYIVFICNDANKANEALSIVTSHEVLLSRHVVLLYSVLIHTIIANR